jgi:hypothetical protein
MTVSPKDNTLIATTTIQTQAELSKWASDLLKFAKIKNHPILLPQEFQIISRAPCG